MTLFLMHSLSILGQVVFTCTPSGLSVLKPGAPYRTAPNFVINKSATASKQDERAQALTYKLGSTLQFVCIYYLHRRALFTPALRHYLRNSSVILPRPLSESLVVMTKLMSCGLTSSRDENIRMLCALAQRTTRNRMIENLD